MYPKVSVIMPVYNGKQYLKEAINSIINQTYKNFEFIILDGGSTDGSLNIIKQYKDDRIKLIQSEKRLSLVKSLNVGIKLSRGEYIARMDCDDISIANRLERQINFMDNHRNVGVCGSWIKTFGGKVNGIIKYPCSPQELKISLLFRNSLAHPSIMMRKSMLEKDNLYYDESYSASEDYEMWFRCNRFFELANIPEVLLYYRLSENSASQTRSDIQKAMVTKIHNSALKYININYKDSDLSIHNLASLNFKCKSRDDLEQFHDWLIRLKSLLISKYEIDNIKIERILGDIWFDVCNYTGTKYGYWTLKKYTKSSLAEITEINLKKLLIFYLKCLLKYSTN